MSDDGYYQHEAYDEYERERHVRDARRQDWGDYFKDRLADVRQRAAATQAERIAAWRAGHPEAMCSDVTVLALLDIEAVGNRATPR